MTEGIQFTDSAMFEYGEGPEDLISVPRFELFPSLLPQAAPWALQGEWAGLPLAPTVLSYVGWDPCSVLSSICFSPPQNSLEYLIICGLQAHYNCSCGLITL